MGDPHSVCTESAGADNTPAPSVPHTDDTSTSVTSTDPPNANTVKGIWYPDWLVSSQRLVMFESLTVKVNLTICVWLNNHSAPTSEETESTKPRIWTFLRKWLSTYKWLLYHATQDTDFEMLKLCISKSVFSCIMDVTYDKGTHL